LRSSSESGLTHIQQTNVNFSGSVDMADRASIPRHYGEALCSHPFANSERNATSTTARAALVEKPRDGATPIVVTASAVIVGNSI
jgi:hypothetical protein